MPKSAAVATEKEMKSLVQVLKDNQELSVTRVRELLKVGYTKARRLLDEAVAGQEYVPPVDVPASTDDKDVIDYIKKLIAEKREVKPDILRRDLNIGYKRAKRLIDSMGGNRAGKTVIPPIARKPRTGKKKKTVVVKIEKPKVVRRRKLREDGADVIAEAERPTKRRKAEKRVPVHLEQPYSDEDEDESEVAAGVHLNAVKLDREVKKEVEEEEDDVSLDSEEDSSSEERVVECILDKRHRKHKVEYLLKWVGLPDSENSWSSAIDAGCEGLVPAFEEQLLKEKGKGRRKHSSIHPHDESHAHIMLMLQQGTQLPDEAEKATKEHRHHEHGHHEHGHHHSHHHRDSHHVQGHEHGHHDHGHHDHGHHHHSHHSHHHSSHHKENGHHHHHSHHHHSHGHGHHHSHHHHDRHRSIMNIVEGAKCVEDENCGNNEPSHSCSSEGEHNNNNGMCEENTCCDDAVVSANDFTDGVIATTPNTVSTTDDEIPPSVTNNINALSEFVSDRFPSNTNLFPSDLSTSSISIGTEMGLQDN